MIDMTERVRAREIHYPSAGMLRLSHRVQSLRPSSTLAVDARFKAMKAQGLNVIGFGVLSG